MIQKTNELENLRYMREEIQDVINNLWDSLLSEDEFDVFTVINKIEKLVNDDG